MVIMQGAEDWASHHVLAMAVIGTLITLATVIWGDELRAFVRGGISRRMGQGDEGIQFRSH